MRKEQKVLLGALTGGLAHGPVAADARLCLLARNAEELERAKAQLPAGAERDVRRRGRESESRRAPSLATTLSDRADVLNDEV